MKDVKIEHSGDRLTVFMGGDIDHHSAKFIREAADSAIKNRKPKTLIIDFSKVEFMDSSGIGFIIGRASEARRMGADEVLVAGLSPALMKLVRMAGIEKIQGVRIGDGK